MSDAIEEVREAISFDFDPVVSREAVVAAIAEIDRLRAEVAAAHAEIDTMAIMMGMPLRERVAYLVGIRRRAEEVEQLAKRPPLRPAISADDDGTVIVEWVTPHGRRGVAIGAESSWYAVDATECCVETESGDVTVPEIDRLRAIVAAADGLRNTLRGDHGRYDNGWCIACLADENEGADGHRADCALVAYDLAAEGLRVVG